MERNGSVETASVGFDVLFHLRLRFGRIEALEPRIARIRATEDMLYVTVTALPNAGRLKINGMPDCEECSEGRHLMFPR